jgi:uncharacterized membrane protein (Fun14 family)
LKGTFNKAISKMGFESKKKEKILSFIVGMYILSNIAFPKLGF